MTNDEIRKRNLEQAIQPVEYEIDNERVKNPSIPDRIALDNHLGKKKVSKDPFAAVKMARISTQGPER